MALGNGATRTIVAALAVPFVLAACYFGNIYFLIFTLFIGVLSFYELSKMFENKQASVLLCVGYAGTAGIILNTYFEFMNQQHLILIIVLLALIIELFRNKGSAINNVGSTLLGILYPGLFASFVLAIREFYKSEELLYNQGGYMIIAILISIWFCDSAAYFIGCAIGKHKLYPRVSPKKSWEGAISGFVFSIVGFSISKLIFFDNLSWGDAIIFGVIIGIIGQIGDLIESLVKRDAGVKDSSNLIPGHGGVLDRFDSLLITAPVVYLYMYYFL